MEDEHSIVFDLPNHPGASFFGVFDGHGGDQVVEAMIFFQYCQALTHLARRQFLSHASFIAASMIFPN